MRGRDREVAKHEPEPLAHPGLHLFDDRIRGTAVRALVVAVLDERHGRLHRTLDVVPLCADRHGECRLPPGRAHAAPVSPRLSRARRIPSAPGFTPTGGT